MNIKGMDMEEISNLMQPYIADYFKNCKISGLDEVIFDESYQFTFTELKHLIPSEYHGQFKDSDILNGASGYVLFESKADEFRGSLYTTMLISDKEYAKALFLLIKEENDVKHTNKDTMLVDFLKQNLN